MMNYARGLLVLAGRDARLKSERIRKIENSVTSQKRYGFRVLGGKTRSMSNKKVKKT